MGLNLLATIDSAVYFEYLLSDQLGYPLTLSVSRCGGRERKENFHRKMQVEWQQLTFGIVDLPVCDCGWRRCEASSAKRIVW